MVLKSADCRITNIKNAVKVVNYYCMVLIGASVIASYVNRLKNTK